MPDIAQWGVGWRDWQRGTVVESTAGMRGTVVNVNVPKCGGSMGNAWVRVRWDSGSEGRTTPTNIRLISGITEP